MTRATISHKPTVSLAEALDLIIANPDLTFMLKGPPGIGKSYLWNTMKERLSHSHNFPTIVDVPNLDVGDNATPVVDRERMVTNYAPNARYMLTEGKPVVLMLDEFSKGVPMIRNTLHPLFEVSNRRLGDIRLPKGSYVIGTGNLDTDGVGDNLQAHSRNRLVVLYVRPPTATEWLDNYAKPKGLNGAVMRWVEETPQCLDFYVTTSVEGNPYPYNPRVPQDAFVTCRSLEESSQLVDSYFLSQSSPYPITHNGLMCSLAGTVGEAAANDMLAVIQYMQQLASFSTIVENPDSAPVPQDPGACAVLVYSIVPRINKPHLLPPVMKYIQRLDREWQVVFVDTLSKSPNQKHAYACDAYNQWLLANVAIL